MDITRNATCGLSAILVPRCGVLFGAFVNPEGADPASAFRQAESLTHARFDIVHYYHQGTDLFPTPWERSLAREPGKQRVLLMNWKPEAGNTWARVAQGASDAYIDREARYLKGHFHQRFFLAIHHEPEDEVRETAGSGYRASDYRAMYRHVVERFRAAGVSNAVYVMNYMGAQTFAVRSWYKSLWPGRKYVDWIAFDPYSTAIRNGQTGGFSRLMNLHWGSGAWRGEYAWARSHHPHKPIMLGEWGIGEKPGTPGWKAWMFDTVRRDLPKFPYVKALVYFQNAQARSGDVRVETSTISLTAFQRLAASAAVSP